jgi:predicted PolB exonuclease-like 3'-5' exonuclease
MLIYDFVMNIFKPLYRQLPEFEFEDYMTYFTEKKEGNVIASTKSYDHVLVIDEAMSELFWPTKQ